MTLPDFLRADEYGELFLSGHRITLYHVVKSYQQDHSEEALAVQFPTLSRSLINKVIAFYLENQSEVAPYIVRTQAEIERQAALPSRGPTMAELKRRLNAKREAESA